MSTQCAIRIFSTGGGDTWMLFLRALFFSACFFCVSFFRRVLSASFFCVFFLRAFFFCLRGPFVGVPPESLQFGDSFNKHPLFSAKNRCFAVPWQCFVGSWA